MREARALKNQPFSGIHLHHVQVFTEEFAKSANVHLRGLWNGTTKNYKYTRVQIICKRNLTSSLLHPDRTSHPRKMLWIPPWSELKQKLLSFRALHCTLKFSHPFHSMFACRISCPSIRQVRQGVPGGQTSEFERKRCLAQGSVNLFQLTAFQRVYILGATA